MHNVIPPTLYNHTDLPKGAGRGRRTVPTNLQISVIPCSLYIGICRIPASVFGRHMYKLVEGSSKSYSTSHSTRFPSTLH